jgi:hypothetical protein
MTPQMKNVLEALKQNKRNWVNHLFGISILSSYDGRTLNALESRGLLKIHYLDHDGIGKEGYYLHDV